MKKTVSHRVGEISLENNIYRLLIREDADIELQDAIDLIRIGTEMTRGMRVVAVVDAKRNFTISGEARKYFAENTVRQQFAATAIITGSLAQRLIINFFINMNRPEVPTRLFRNETDAMAWLKGFQ